LNTIRDLKKELEDLLTRDDWSESLERVAVMEGRRVINPLLSFLCRDEEELRWRAVTAIGVVVDHMARNDMEGARIIMRRLMWTLNDESGGIGWGAAESMAEIMARNERLADLYAHMLISYLDEEGNFLEFELLQRGLLWGLVRLAEVRLHLLGGAVHHLGRYLASPDSTVRGYAALLAGILGGEELRESLETLREDRAGLRFFTGGELKTTTVAEMAERALSKLGRPG
jgi:HEAT repeat protein